MTEVQRPWAVILAGGTGTRLWPLARAAHPKQFLPLFHDESLFQQACRRAALVAGRSRILVVTGQSHLGWVRRQAPWIPVGRVIVEGVGRNTAAAVALAAHWIRAPEADGVMVIIPADHWIGPAVAFRGDILRAVAAARRTGALVTVGVRARSPDSGFGYILPVRRGPGHGAVRVRSFVEKPRPAVARRMVGGGEYLWNSGLFAWRADSILAALERCRPGLARAVARAVPSRRRGAWRIAPWAMRRIPAASIDEAVLERSTNLLVVRATFRWSDLGNWNALGAILSPDRHGNRCLGKAITVGAGHCVSVSPAGLIALVGVRDLVVVHDREVVLVCTRRDVQRLREAHGFLRGRLAVHA